MNQQQFFLYFIVSCSHGQQVNFTCSKLLNILFTVLLPPTNNCYQFLSKHRFRQDFSRLKSIVKNPPYRGCL